MFIIESKSNKLYNINKNIINKIDFFKIYLSDEYVDDKNIIKLDYPNYLISYLVNYLNNKHIFINKKKIMQYVYFLNYIGFDEPILNIIDLIKDYKKEFKNIYLLTNLYPKYIVFIQNKLNNYIFTKQELDELELKYNISNLDLYFKILNDNTKNIKLVINIKNGSDLIKFNYLNIYGLYYNKNILTFPKEIKYLINIQILDLSYNNIEIIPIDIQYLINLKKLNISNNKIKGIPKEINNLIKLESLSLYNNEISIIPKEIKKLINLNYLYLYNNKISIIPNEINDLTNLIYLNIYNNKIIKFDINLIKLEYLNLGKNKISNISKEIKNLINLQELDLSANKISILPLEIKYLLNLKNLDLTNNIIKQIPIEFTDMNKIIIL
jgi:Leucine-rich repeat (LRR) protein